MTALSSHLPASFSSLPRVGHYKKMFALLALLLAVVSGFPVSSQAVTTGNQYVMADVEENTGYITIFTAQTLGKKALSYQGKSYLTCKIDGKYYTNNPYVLGPTNVVSLQVGGQISIKRATTLETGDTVRTTWSDKDGVDIIQDVWPVAFTRSGQIIISIRYRNTKGGPIAVETQFLLDTKVDNNDRAKILTRYGYAPVWKQYPNAGQPKIPNFYLTFQNDLPNSPSFDPGLTGQGYTDYPPLGLIKPFRVTIGDWNALLSYLWGPPSPLPSTPYTDSGVLMEFGATGANPGKTVEGARTSYGTGEFESCLGKIYAITFYPHLIKYNGSSYIPNPFTVESFIFNTDQFQSASNSSFTLTMGPNLKIIAPSPVGGGGAFQTQATVPSSIPPLEVGYATWDVQADLAQNCNGMFSTFMTLTGTTSLGNPTFASQCDLPVNLPCTSLDRDPPIVDVRGGSGRDKSFRIHDDRNTDTGLKKVTWTATNASNFSVRIDQFAPCSQTEQPYVNITQLDTCLGGTLTFTILDCLDNATTEIVNFTAKTCLFPVDSFRPRFFKIATLYKHGEAECTEHCDTVEVLDTLPDDEGLKFLQVEGTPRNMTFTRIEPFTIGTKKAYFKVCVDDSLLDGDIAIRAEDVKGNFDIMHLLYCTQKDTLNPLLSATQPSPEKWNFHTDDVRPWDRGLASVTVTGTPSTNIAVNKTPAELINLNRIGSFDFGLSIVDTFQRVQFCVTSKDTAGNQSTVICQGWEPKPDDWTPNLTVTPKTPPTSPLGKSDVVTIDVNDIHYYAQPPSEATKIGWDRGIDSVWFTNANGVTLPFQSQKLNCAMTMPSFDVKVIDTLSIQPNACFTVNVRDCPDIKGATRFTSSTYCYDIAPDVMSPVITGTVATQNQVSFDVKDDQIHDRGLETVILDGTGPYGLNNFDPLQSNLTSLNGAMTTSLTLSMTDRGKSATGTLKAVDKWGTLVPADAPQHTAGVNVNIWVQDMEMKKSHLILQTGDFKIPVFFKDNDNFDVSLKKLGKFSMSFRMAGAPGITFLGIDKANTVINNWTIDPPVNNAGVITITATAPAGEYLAGRKTDTGDTVFFLLFNGQESEITAISSVEIVSTNGTSIVYNDGVDKTIVGVNANAIVPAPYGSLEGMTVGVKGSCSPIAVSDSAGAKPTMVSLDPVQPNPFGPSATIRYTVPAKGQVMIELFSNLGAPVKTIVNEVQEQGTYEVRVPSADLAKGSYYVRLQAAGKTKTRTVRHE